MTLEGSIQFVASIGGANINTTLTDTATGAGRDTYYLRVRQKNDQWAWTSPIFVG